MPEHAYGIKSERKLSDLEVEIYAIKWGGNWKSSKGEPRGNGIVFHRKRFMQIAWPWTWFTKWDDLIIENWDKYSTIGIMGPASACKTFNIARLAMEEYICHPFNTAITCSTSTIELLDGRIWADMRRLWEEVQDRFGAKVVQGDIVEHRRMIITNTEGPEGKKRRDFRMGVRGVAVEEGRGYRNFIGVKQERVILLVDECQDTDAGFLDAVANVSKTPTMFKMVGLGNPKGLDNSLAKICEPKGGWENADRREITKTWETRIKGGICINLVGTDGPNKGFPKGQEPYPPLIKDWQIEDDRERYGEQSLLFWQYTLGMMPMGELVSRIITLSLCNAGHAFDEPNFHGRKITKVIGLDCATGVLGGDRTIMIEGWFGPETGTEKDIVAINNGYHKVPIDPATGEDPEYQIAKFVKRYCTTAGIPPEHVFYDATGRGSLGSAFAREWGVCTPIEFGGLATDRIVSAGDNRMCHEAYGNFVTELWYLSRVTIEGGQMRGLTREIMDDGSHRNYNSIGKRKVVVVPKHKMKELRLPSPDIWDALVTMLEGCRRMGFRPAGVSRKHGTDKPWWFNQREAFRKSWQTLDLVPESN